MPAKLNLAGQTFGRLTVVAEAPRQRGLTHWHCVCECGNELIAQTSNIKSGNTNSCGCFRREAVRAAKTTHGRSYAPEYGPWKAMVHRCTNPNSVSWPDYGGRGITVHPSLMTIEGFIAEIGLRPSPQHTIERIDNKGHYEPGNIRWDTRKQQSRNQRSNRLLTHDGRTQSAAAWAEEFGMPRGRLYDRLKRGWSVERALTEPVHSACQRTCHHRS